MIKPEWTFILDKKHLAWECECTAINSMDRCKCGKCHKMKRVKKYF